MGLSEIERGRERQCERRGVCVCGGGGTCRGDMGIYRLTKGGRVKDGEPPKGGTYKRGAGGRGIVKEALRRGEREREK